MRSCDRADAPWLTGLHATVQPDDTAAGHAGRLLAALGARIEQADAGRAALASSTPSDAVGDWAASGAMALTGRRSGPPLMAPGAVASAARGAMLAFEWLTASRLGVDGHRLLGERAAIGALGRQAPRSVGGAFRLLAAADGWLGISLARRSDFDALPALVQRRVTAPWPAVAAWARHVPAAAAAERAQLLGLPAAAVCDGDDAQSRQRWGAAPVGPFRLQTVRSGAGRRDRGALDGVTVVDLSSLWAGPLCANLLGLAGARVVKVESIQRPDGARRGAERFFAVLHEGHESVRLDFDAAAGRRELRAMLGAADVVIEASRPRALVGLGIDAADVLAERPSCTWVSITAYGRDGPWANRVGYGDDAAAAAGLVARDVQTGAPLPCGDAIADPLTGIHAAVVAAAGVLAGGSRMVDIAMRDVAAVARAGGDADPSAQARRSGGRWWIDTPHGPAPVEPPHARGRGAA